MNSVSKELAKILANVAEHPVEFIEKILGHELWSKQKEIVHSVFKNTQTSVKSCHASGKSFNAAQIVPTFLFAYPYESAVVTTAPTWRQVESVLWKEIRASHKQAKIPLGGVMNVTEYKLDEKWYAVGLSTNEPDKFNGFHSKYLLVIKDESSGIPVPIHEAIEGVASTGMVRILELGNPTDPTGHFASTFKDPFYNKISISCFDTPNFEFLHRKAHEQGIKSPTTEQLIELLRESTEEERANGIVASHLISPEWVFRRLHRWGPDSPMFQARCLGEFPLEGDDTLIPLRYALRSLFDPEKAQDLGNKEVEVLGVDVARFGSDKTVLAYRRGNQIVSLEKFSKQDTMATAGQVVKFARMHPYAKINIDDTGVGGGVTDRIREVVGRQMQVNGINVGSAPNDKDQFVNLRAELYWGLRDRFEKQEIVLPADDDDLVSELTSIKYKMTSRGQIQIESKDDMKKRGLNSPDSADAVMLAFADVATNGFLEFYAQGSKE